ncbi:hypothetical protein PM082_014859 [Marasmius tenuissimus]|nr:hypothetical protein PM082_014859 [Marasmius tenuissimus]
MQQAVSILPLLPFVFAPVWAFHFESLPATITASQPQTLTWIRDESDRATSLKFAFLNPANSLIGEFASTVVNEAQREGTVAFTFTSAGTFRVEGLAEGTFFTAQPTEIVAVSATATGTDSTAPSSALTNSSPTSTSTSAANSSEADQASSLASSNASELESSQVPTLSTPTLSTPLPTGSGTSSTPNGGSNSQMKVAGSVVGGAWLLALLPAVSFFYYLL